MPAPDQVTHISPATRATRATTFLDYREDAHSQQLVCAATTPRMK